MRPAAFTTIAFLAGQHGFGIFVPYLGVFLVTACAIRTWRHRSAMAAAEAVVRVPAIVGG